jgi:quinoprotein glucose dehydrogenase
MNSVTRIEESSVSRWLRRSYAVLLVLVGAALLLGGVTLLTYGGSPYYALAGIAMAVSAVLIWRRDRRGAWLYGALLVLTVAWAIWEVGFNSWGLVARVAALLVLGAPLSLPALRSKGEASEATRVRGWPAFVGGLMVAMLSGAGLYLLASQPIDPLMHRGMLARAPNRLAQPLAAVARDDWQQYGNDAGGTRFSPLTDITPQNVSTLQVAWEADTGPADPNTKGSLEVTPINIGDALYLCSAYNAVISLDAETGHERWRYQMSP